MPKAQVELPAQTKIPLVLTQELSAGDAKEGEKVKLMVEKDVQVGGKTVVAEGTPVEAEVVWSRGASLASSVINQPARLAISTGSVRTVDGQTIALASTGKEPKRFEFNRSNTGAPPSQNTLERLWTDDEQRQTLERLARRLAENDRSVSLDDPDTRASLEAIAKELNLRQTQQWLDESKKSSKGLDGVLKSLQSGSAKGIGSGEIELALGAVQELSRLAGSVDRTLRQKIKAPTVRAPLGTKIELRTAEAATVAVPR